jgi:hypothetical protein
MTNPAECLIFGLITMAICLIALSWKGDYEVVPSPHGHVGKVFWYGYLGYGLTLIGWSLSLFLRG